jgi:hypothetical protein
LPTVMASSATAVCARKLWMHTPRAQQGGAS